MRAVETSFVSHTAVRRQAGWVRKISGGGSEETGQCRAPLDVGHLVTASNSKAEVTVKVVRDRVEMGRGGAGVCQKGRVAFGGLESQRALVSNNGTRAPCPGCLEICFASLLDQTYPSSFSLLSCCSFEPIEAPRGPLGKLVEEGSELRP